MTSFYKPDVFPPYDLNPNPLKIQANPRVWAWLFKKIGCRKIGFTDFLTSKTLVIKVENSKNFDFEKAKEYGCISVLRVNIIDHPHPAEYFPFSPRIEIYPNIILVNDRTGSNKDPICW